MTEEEALNDIYGVDIMADNVEICKRRLGGGNILVGNTLSPTDRIDGQSDEDHEKMIEWFGEPNLSQFFGLKTQINCVHCLLFVV